jgi:hypothetical protein
MCPRRLPPKVKVDQRTLFSFDDPAGDRRRKLGGGGSDHDPARITLNL